MQNRYGFSQFNNPFVDPVYNASWDYLLMEKILHCENLDFR